MIHKCGLCDICSLIQGWCFGVSTLSSALIAVVGISLHQTIPMLSERQKGELNRAIYSYISSQTSDPHVLESLRDIFAFPEPDSSQATSTASPHDLERRWTALIRLQRKLIGLEQQNEALRAELSSQRDNNNADGRADNWLPRMPAAATMTGHRGKVNAVAFHPRWSMLCSASDDGSIKVWDSETGDLEKTIKAHPRAVLSLAFGATSDLLVSSSVDATIRVWDSQHEFSNTLTLLGHDHTVSDVKIISQEKNGPDALIVSCSRDTTIRIWQIETGDCVRVLKPHSDWVRCLSCSIDNSLILSAGTDRTPYLSQVNGGENWRFSGGHSHVIECCAFAPEVFSKTLDKHFPQSNIPSGVYFATGGRDNIIAIWHSSQLSSPLFKLVGHENWVQGLAFHPSGRFLVSVGDDCTIRTWDLTPPGKLVRVIENAHSSFLTSIAWKERRIATGSVDQAIKLWK